MHKVKRAIIMAAGMGKRLLPLTLQTPKPLIKVNGITMIESLINGFHENGIFDIYIVVGYRKEAFEFLVDKYKGVTLIENPYYKTCNNISSLYVAREYLEDVIIADGDQVICNSKVLESDFEHSGYNSVWVEHKTDEWLQCVKEGRVTACSRTGGTYGWQLYSISRWTAQDGERLRKHLEYEFEVRKNRQIYWDDVVMFCHFEEYELGIYKMQENDVKEIDSLQELVMIDKAYKQYLGDSDGE